MRPVMVGSLRRYVVAGVIILLPLVLTAYIFWFFIHTLDNLLGGLAVFLVGRRIPGLGVLLSLLLVLGVGVIGANVLGRRFIEFGESLLLRLPLVRTVYTSIKQLLMGFVLDNKNAFQQVVLVEYPRPGMYSLAFVTRQGAPWYQGGGSEELYSLFIPTTPNPTSGYMLLVPREQLEFLDMSVEDALKMIISGGLVSPNNGAIEEDGANGA
ncbi:MAG: DUF502 domain-containing protein [Limnochordia bacterium]|nr:DUF502 domain-containing protein [Bacillota bacterium]